MTEGLDFKKAIAEMEKHVTSLVAKRADLVKQVRAVDEELKAIREQSKGLGMKTVRPVLAKRGPRKPKAEPTPEQPQQ
jgi:hypothetical protein